MNGYLEPYKAIIFQRDVLIASRSYHSFNYFPPIYSIYDANQIYCTSHKCNENYDHNTIFVTLRLSQAQFNLPPLITP